MSRSANRTWCHTRELTGLLEAAECRGEIGAENIGEIATLLNEHGRKTEPRDRGTNSPEAIGRHRQSSQRIAFGGIEAERDDERAGRESADGFCRDVERGEIAVIGGAERQRNVEIGAFARARAALMGITPDIEIVERRIGMD